MVALVGAVAIVGILILDGLSIVWGGYVLSVLWGWFVVPAFGLPPLTIPVAIGVSLVAAVLTHQLTAEPEHFLAKVMVRNFTSPAIAMLIGWVVLHFMPGAL